MVTLIKRDIRKILKNQEVEVFLHGCNCFNTMGAGVAKLIKDIYPEVYEADLATKKDDKKKLGTIVSVKISEIFTVVNCYTQYSYGRNMRYVDYDILKSVLRQVIQQFPNKVIGMPFIGAGLAGGDKQEVLNIIESVFINNVVYVYYL